MEQEELFDKIDAYLWDLLSTDTRTEFEQEIVADKALAKEVAIRRMEHQAMQILLKSDLRTKMQAWEVEEETITSIASTPLTVASKQTGGRVVKMTFMRMAAAAAFILGIVGVVFWSNQSYSDAALFARFGGDNTLRGNNQSIISDAPEYYTKGLEKLDNNDYDEAIKLLSSVTDSLFFEKSRLATVEALLKQKKYDQSAALCRDIISRKTDNQLVQKAEWQLTLILLADGKKSDELLRLVNRISQDSSHNFQKEAIDLKAKLDSFWRKFSF
jgi:hypothetical protein